MGNSKNAHHLDRINLVIDYIDLNLDHDLSLSVLAEVALLSPFHFHRIFTAATNETLHAFVQRKRLERIARVLLSDKVIPIKELALKYGFESPVSFSRAFRKFYGITASELKRWKKGPVNRLIRNKSKIGKEIISVEEYISNTEEVRGWMKQNSQPTVRLLEKQKLAYIRNRGSFEDVYLAFNNLKTWADQTGLLSGKQGVWLMVIHDSPTVTEENRMMQSAALSIKEKMEFGDGIGELMIPKGNYLIGRFRVSDEGFKNAWDGMTVYLIDNDIQTREGYYFERFYTDSLFNPGQKHDVEICIPVV